MKFVGFALLFMTLGCVIILSGFTLPTTIALPVLILAVALDFLTTWACLRKGGREGNPIMALAFRKLGLTASLGIMVILWTCLIMFRIIHQPESIQTAVALSYWIVPINNTMLLMKLSRKRQAC